MPTKWGTKRWGTFRWGDAESLSAELTALLDRKDGLIPHRRITWKLDAGDQDLTNYFLNVSAVSQEKERAPDRVAAGDATLTFSNTSGVFTDTSTTSILYGINYHNRDIVIEIGLELSDGSVEYIKVATMKVRATNLSSDKSRFTIRVYDLVRRLLTETVNRKPESMMPVANAGNTGNGKCSDIDIMPFVNVSQNWTLTCTLGGGSATFSVVGSVSGNIGTATIGTEFLNATSGGVKFTVRGGDVNFVIGDIFTFSTVKMMEFATTNPVKIIWSILTGYNWDTNIAEDWVARTPQLDHTLTAANVDLNYTAFATAVANSTFDIKGFVAWDKDLVAAIEEIILHFLGAVNVDAEGRLYIKIWRPDMSQTRVFADTKKNMSMSMLRDTQDMINWVSFKYRKSNTWPWSDADEENALDGLYVSKDAASYTNFKQWFTLNLKTTWYNEAGDHVSFPAVRLIERYAAPPRRFSFKTGLDGLDTELGDIIGVSDSGLGYSVFPVEIMKKDGDYAAKPAAVSFEAEDTGTGGTKWCFLGSSADEGDGVSPQASDYNNATVGDKMFCYLSQTGGSGGAGPDYFLFGATLALLCLGQSMGMI